MSAVGCEVVALRAVEGIENSNRPILVLPTLWYGYSPHHGYCGHHHPAIGNIPGRRSGRARIGSRAGRAARRHSQRARRQCELAGCGGIAAGSRLAWQGADRRRHLFPFGGAAPGRVPPVGDGHGTRLRIRDIGPTLRPSRVGRYVRRRHLPSRHQSTDLFGTSTVRSYHDFKDLSASGTLGDPSLASREKGEAILRICVEELRGFFREFADWPIA